MTTDLTAASSSSLLERHLHDFLEANPSSLGLGKCKVIARELVVDSGRIDLVVETEEEQIWAVELKIGIAGRDAVAQIASYLGALQEEHPDRKVSGLLIAADFDTPARRAHKVVRGIALKRFNVLFSLEDVAPSTHDSASLAADEDENQENSGSTKSGSWDKLRQEIIHSSSLLRSEESGSGKKRTVEHRCPICNTVKNGLSYKNDKCLKCGYAFSV